MFEQSELELLGEDPGHRVVNPRHRDLARVDEAGQRRLELLEVLRLHEHVDAGHHARLHPHGERRLRVAGLGVDVIDAVVVRDHDPVEVHRSLQPAGDQIPVGVHVDPVAEPIVGEVDIRVGRHDGAHVVLAHGGHVGREREALERGVTDLVNALIDRIVAGRLVVRSGAVGGEAVAGEVLGGGHHAVGIREVPGRALEAVDGGLHHLHEVGVLAEGLIGAAPAVVARDADAGGKDPLRPRRPRLFGGDMLNVVHQPWVTAGAQADVMREHRRAVHVPVAVHGVDAVQDRNV